MINEWAQRAADFLHQIETPSGHPSTPDGPVTLYGSCYAWQALNYLGHRSDSRDKTISKMILKSQRSDSGLFCGPELENLDSRATHSHAHLVLHTTCSAALPVIQELNIEISPIAYAKNFLSEGWMKNWTQSIDWKNAWLEGNNILFVGQLLVFLRDFEKNSDAQKYIDKWFSWLDETVDHKTGLWGTNGYCDAASAIYGGYHQLLVYFHENRPPPNLTNLIDTALSIQHPDGGFSYSANAGACEDIDAVDILVNSYKRVDYRRAEIRQALRRCARHILETQGQDGGFPYQKNKKQSHMGIPGSFARENVSCTFPTWFRVHTLCLIAEILPSDPMFAGLHFRFNSSLSMGWHRSPPDWNSAQIRSPITESALELLAKLRLFRWKSLRSMKRFSDRIFRNIT